MRLLPASFCLLLSLRYCLFFLLNFKSACVCIAYYLTMETEGRGGGERSFIITFQEQIHLGILQFGALKP